MESKGEKGPGAILRPSSALRRLSLSRCFAGRGSAPFAASPLFRVDDGTATLVNLTAYMLLPSQHTPRSTKPGMLTACQPMLTPRINAFTSAPSPRTYGLNTHLFDAAGLGLVSLWSPFRAKLH